MLFALKSVLGADAREDAVANADFHQAASPSNENEAGDSVSRSTGSFMLYTARSRVAGLGPYGWKVSKNSSLGGLVK